MNLHIIEQIRNHMESDLLSLKEKWTELIDNNIWLDYLLQCDMHGNENWIDFESEISKVIKILDKDIDQYRGKDNLYSVV